MARKGDIDSKGIASRVPMDVYIRLLTKATSEKKTISSFLCEILSNEDLTLPTDKLKEENHKLILIISELIRITSEPKIKEIIDNEFEDSPILKMDKELLKKVMFHAFKKK